MGTATDNPELTDLPYLAILSNFSEFGAITPGNSLKWEYTEPERGVFTFAGGDQIVDLAQSNGQIIRAHNLVWDSELPSWLTTPTNWTAEDITDIIQTHISNVAGHYAGQVYCWDVVNEPLNSDGTFVSDVFSTALGSEYISVALTAARAADPNAKLYINDYNLEYTGAKVNAMVALVQSLQANGVPIDGIGFESHFEVGTVPSASAIAANMELFTSLGLEVAITELDVRIQLPETAALREQQKSDFQSVVQACEMTAACVGVTVWDFTDKYSWVPGTFAGWGAATPYDDNLVKKPAYDGIIAGFEA